MQRMNKTLFLSFLVLFSVSAAPASAQEAIEDPKQPSVDNPHMHFWGTDDLSSCWTHFDSNDSSGSTEGGYGEMQFSQGQRIEVEYTCAMQESFQQDMYLDSNGTIELRVVVNTWTGNCGENDDCENLNITLFKGVVQVARQEFPAVDNNGNDESIIWEIPVDANMTRWNKSGEEPRVQFEYSMPGYSGVECVLPITDCSGHFGMFYENNEDGNDARVIFPVVNKTEAGIEDGPGSGSDDSGSGLLPGFGLLLALSSLAMASIAIGRKPPLDGSETMEKE